MLPGNSLILVCYLPSERDYEYARLLGWYRIPLRSSPKIIEVDYLAFYQGNDFGVARRWKIEYLAEFRGVELTTRKELLKEEASHPRANEEYYKVQIGPLLKLPCPICAEDWKRITFFYTLGELVNNASIVNDLILRSEARAGIWQALRERNQKGGIYQSSGSIPDISESEILLLLLADPRSIDVDRQDE